MPLNFIDNPSSYNTVLFFFDGQQSGVTSSGSEMILNVISLDYYIFPAKSKTFVFGLGMNYDDQTKEDYPYRYEFKRPLLSNDNIMYELNGHENVTITLTGNTWGCKIVDGELTAGAFTSDYAFTGEIYDGADYTSSEHEYWQNFHPLSNTENSEQENNVELWIENGAFVSNDTGAYSYSGIYTFTDIQEPFFDRANPEEEPDHNYMFQCVSPCKETAVLLTIRNFSFSVYVEEAD